MNHKQQEYDRIRSTFDDRRNFQIIDPRPKHPEVPTWPVQFIELAELRLGVVLRENGERIGTLTPVRVRSEPRLWIWKPASIGVQAILLCETGVGIRGMIKQYLDDQGLTQFQPEWIEMQTQGTAFMFPRRPFTVITSI